ncbi:hypothetical protein ACIRPT_16460 [Streptomyces sp. NPDC101227]|uniref:hypothetical protein n=1 Tax=Streptomyces sp. NPDC101227 TaxID=3366136 RepID=UPI00380E55CB
MPDDYFGRLLARYAPPGRDGSAEAGAGRRVLVRPRLAEPFERVEALGTAPAAPEGPAPLFPEAPRAGASEGERVRHDREIRTFAERETVVRGEPPRRDETERLDAPQLLSAERLLLPATAPFPGLRDASSAAVRPRGRAEVAREDGPARGAAPAPGPRASDAAPRAVAPALRPRTDEVSPARTAARAAASGRRGQRPAERVVHVQIGRLEVSAAGPERPTAGGRAARTERRGPSLSLTDYLSRDEKRN